MPRPYNKKTVKDALLLLDIYASNGCTFEEAASGAEVRPSSTGYRVAEHLVDKLADMFPEERLAAIAGEAAGLLREGWRIGDEIPQHANTQLANKIIEQTYSPDEVERLSTMESPVFATLSKLEVSHGPAETEESRALTRVGEILAEPLDAVEEPTDEEIEEFDSQTEFDGDKHEQPDTLTGDALDPWEPTE